MGHTAESESVWIKSSGSNLLMYKPSGMYFARVRWKGKLYRASLHTTSMSIAKLKLGRLREVYPESDTGRC